MSNTCANNYRSGKQVILQWGCTSTTRVASARERIATYFSKTRGIGASSAQAAISTLTAIKSGLRTLLGCAWLFWMDLSDQQSSSPRHPHQQQRRPLHQLHQQLSEQDQAHGRCQELPSLPLERAYSVSLPSKTFGAWQAQHNL